MHAHLSSPHTFFSLGSAGGDFGCAARARRESHAVVDGAEELSGDGRSRGVYVPLISLGIWRHTCLTLLIGLVVRENCVLIVVISC
jgi:hypothetical protein